MEASPPRIHCLRDDTEWVLEENPDIIIGLALAGGYERDNTSILKARYDEIRGTAGFSDINAGKNNKVFVTDPMTVLGPGNHIGVLCFAKWLYPELFNDLDPEKLHQEFIDKFQHVDFDLNKHGAFVYPPLNES
jgi:iron complex transport system substrate-binding protein